MSDQKFDKSQDGGISRRNFLGAGSAAMATAAFAGLAARAQAPENVQAGESSHSFSNPGPENPPLLAENPSSNMPPPTDHGNVMPVWHSFDLTHKRVERGGWTNQVTQRDLPSSKDVSGVRMRLTAGSYRELHWHSANEWALMLYGKARVTVLNPDGTVFIDDVGERDLWFFPTGFPHSIQGLGPDGCEFLLIFDEGMFSEDDTFLISDWVRHTPPDILAKNFRLSRSSIAKLPQQDLYIFPGKLPASLEEDREAVGGKKAESPIQYTFKTGSMAATKKSAAGEVHVIDSHNFPASTAIAAGLVRLKPGGLRELHWHPNASEWQYYISGKGRMTVFFAEGNARTMDFHANDVGFAPINTGHYVQNTGNTDLVYVAVFKANQYLDFSLNNWMRHLPPELVSDHLNLSVEEIRKIPMEKLEVML